MAGMTDAHPRVHLLADLVQRTVGLPRHLGQHSGGVVLCAGDLDDIVPMENASMPGRFVIEWDKTDCEDVGIVKADLLGLGILGIDSLLSNLDTRRNLQAVLVTFETLLDFRAVSSTHALRQC